MRFPGLNSFFRDYILSWFIEPGFDYGRLLKTKSQLEPIRLKGNYDWGMALGRYREDGVIGRSLLGEYIYRFKYGNDRKCGIVLAELLHEKLVEIGIDQEINMATIVPPTRVNKASPMRFILSRIDSDILNEYRTDILLRRKLTAQFKDMPDAEVKRQAVKGVFSVNPEVDIEFKSILVFDDIIDSGTTLNECSRILKEAGAGRVIVMTLATA